MLQLRNIYKKYHNKWILKDVNLAFNKKGLYLITGKNGIGKSTLLNIISLLTKPDQGEILLNGNNIVALNKTGQFNYFATYIGFVFQEYNLIEELSVYDNIELALTNDFSKQVKYKKIMSTLTELGIKNLAKKVVKNLSTGEKQRVAIARAVIKEAKIILLDEPTSSLDPKNKKIILKLIKKISQKSLVICTSHDCDNFIPYADNIITINEDGVHQNSNPNFHEIITYPHQRKVHLTLIQTLKIIKNYIKYKWVKTISTIIIMSILLFFLIILLSINFYTPIKTYRNYLLNKNNEWALLVDSNQISVSIEQLNKIELKKDELEEIYPYYYLDKDFTFNTVFLPIEHIYVKENNELLKNEIIISDYLARFIIETTDSIKDFKGLIKEVIKYSDNELIIKEIFNTSNNDIPNSFSIFMNQETINDLIITNNSIEIVIINDNKDQEVIEIFRNYNDETIKYGSNKLKQVNDILISDCLLYLLTGQKIENNEDFKKLNKDIKIYSYELPNKSIDFNIVGIYTSDLPTLKVTKEMYLNLNLILTEQGIYIKTETPIKVLKKFENNDIYLKSTWIYSYLKLHNIIKFIKKVIVFLLVIILIITYYIFNLFLKQRMVSQKRAIGILISLGIQKSQIRRIFILDALIIFILAYITSLLLSIWFLAKLNKIIKILDFPFSINFIYYPIYIVLLIILLPTTIIFLKLWLKKITKLELIDLLRKTT